MLMKINMCRTSTKPHAKEVSNGSRLWGCAECGDKGKLVVWSYDDLATRGGPVCPMCDEDMILVPDRK